MKLSTTALLLAGPLSVSAAAISSILDYSQSPLGVEPTNELPVNGENPLVFCEDPTKNILQIEKVDISPNPPKPGQVLTVTASGTLGQKIEKGAYVNLEVKYGLITLVKQTADLCDQVTNVDLKCPLNAGKLTLTKQVKLPQQIPPGKYSVLADVYTLNDERVTCLRGKDIPLNMPGQ
ncbi:3-ketoacyl-CoA thiolase peroxisomal [Penicillium chermesinum]|uniref:Phosphatidylglycerol/phosphatidylinositol transfer protein n=1 Tax=Penicillium chermesinum TaxID=63820 RepID=A0A9W9NZC8_9EURO|nr:3-ketoacyl-CoA thiolase peroxisomal [Penicillium chermesinum]KAJ5232654.1 3-ketoacyl-CoA thiolase peroxisomal [Penicillium chermesinum]KAJ6172313.1 3-ketoacyl-CoA thiolase peroxisomal [Penicillium chermesinum]